MNLPTPGLAELKAISANFLTELKAAKAGESQSVSWFAHQLPVVKELHSRILAIALGGSNYHLGIVAAQATGENQISSLHKGKLPLFESREVLFNFTAELIQQFKLLESFGANEPVYIGLNFAHDMEPTIRGEKLDGILLHGSKEHLFRGLINVRLGEELENFLNTKLNRVFHISLANDAICTTLAGRTNVMAAGQKPESLVSGIVGTGMNFALYEPKNTVVNIEAGSFRGYEPTLSGALVRSQSKTNFGIETEISGGYLYQHFNALKREWGITSPDLTDTEQVSTLAAENNGPAEGSEGSATELAQSLLKRSAAFTAATLNAIQEYKALEGYPELTAVMEGSIFWHGFGFKAEVERLIAELNPQLKINFLKIDHSYLYGAAALWATTSTN